jgi:glycine cleavage system aminomethyltransferase T
VDYELYTDAWDAVRLWNAISEAAADFGLVIAGLGARGTLRVTHSSAGTKIWRDVRGRKIEMKIVPLPFYHTQ